VGTSGGPPVPGRAARTGLARRDRGRERHLRGAVDHRGRRFRQHQRRRRRRPADVLQGRQRHDAQLGCGQ